jgi:hypothetical protein
MKASSESGLEMKVQRIAPCSLSRHFARLHSKTGPEFAMNPAPSARHAPDIAAERRGRT